MQQKGNKGEFSNREWIELILHRMTTYLYHKNTTDYRTNSADFHNYMRKITTGETFAVAKTTKKCSTWQTNHLGDTYDLKWIAPIKISNNGALI